MKTALLALLILLVSLVMNADRALAAKAKRAKTPTAASKLGTKFDFEDMMVHGKYQYPDESVTSVEDEKTLDDLLGVRKNFKDRLQQTAGRR